ncbi:hypothetical protein, partial [Paraburkholderia kururiensis]|uniref:hypothetical protein n=1 Tax=Paraburkholderia kururiensis TaxID=984307 RepID=UPI000F88EF9A
MRSAAHIVALVAALAYGCSKHQASEVDKESQLSAARAANEHIQLAIADAKCGNSDSHEDLCSHLKQGMRHLMAAWTELKPVSKVMPVTSSGGDYFGHTECAIIEPQGPT